MDTFDYFQGIEMGENTLYFNDLKGLVVVCYERHSHDVFRNIIWSYEVVVKAHVKAKPSIYYLLAREQVDGKTRYTTKEIMPEIARAISQSIVRIDEIKAKLSDDGFKLHKLFKELNKKGK